MFCPKQKMLKTCVKYAVLRVTLGPAPLLYGNMYQSLWAQWYHILIHSLGTTLKARLCYAFGFRGPPPHPGNTYEIGHSDFVSWGYLIIRGSTTGSLFFSLLVFTTIYCPISPTFRVKESTSIKKMILYLTQVSHDSLKSFSFVCQNLIGSFEKYPKSLRGFTGWLTGSFEKRVPVPLRSSRNASGFAWRRGIWRGKKGFNKDRGSKNDLENKLGKVIFYILIKYTKGIRGARWKLQAGIREPRVCFFRDTKVLGLTSLPIL